MFDRLKRIYEWIININSTIDKYKKDSVIQSLPTVAYVNKAKKLIDSKDYKMAEKVLLTALEISTKDSLVYKYLGRIYELQNDFKQGAHYYQQSANLNEHDKDIWLRLGMCLLYSEQLESAIEAFENADKVIPLNTDVYTGHGMALMKQKKYAQARDKFNKAAQISKYNYTAILLSAVMESRLGEYIKAEEKLSFLIKVAPNESSFYEYAKLQLICEKYEQAEFYALKSIDINKKILPAYFILAEIYSIQKNNQQLENVYKLALSNNLECPLLYYEWGRDYIYLLDFEKSEEKFSKSLLMDAKYIEPKIGLALLYAYKNDFSLFNELNEQYAANSYIQEAQGLKYFYNNEFENAIEMFKKSIKTDNKQTYNYYNIAKVYEKLNNQYKAEEYYEKFTQKNPHYVKGLIDFSKFLINISKFEEAQRKLEKVLKVDSHNLEALNMLFYCKYTLVNKNICEYNIEDAISIANQAREGGQFDFAPQLEQLEDMLKHIREKG